MSSSRISGISAAICASLTSTIATASSLHRRHVAIGAQAAARRGCARSGRAPAADRAAASASALSLMISTAVPPRPNTTTVPKVGSSARPRISSRAFGRTHHRLHDDAGYPRFGPQRPRPRQNLGGRRAHRLGAGEIEHDAADVGFVNDVARHDLEHDGRALREHRARRGRPPARHRQRHRSAPSGCHRRRAAA